MVWLIALQYYAAAAAALYGGAYVYHRILLRTGEPTSIQVQNGKTKIYAISGDVGAPMVYQEIYEQKVYLQNGVSLDGIDAPVVIDAGVNIGMFSRYVAEMFPRSRVFGAEPIDLIADIARRNTAFAGDRVKISTVGLGKSTSKMIIEYVPNLSSASTMHSADIKEAALKDPIDWLRGLMLDGLRGGVFPSFVPVAFVCQLLAIPYARVLVLLGIAPIVILVALWFQAASLPKRKIECKIITLDMMLQEQGLEADTKIDLVKIDVEGAEMDLLEGISDKLWSRIQQIVVETHNIDGRVEKVRRLIASKGFAKVVTADEEWEVHRLLNISSVYAVRK